ncbi:MAG TPA: hypothetical protein VFN58_00030, partial [Candidatus Binatia bacterium]|nr:hypothetical protein [Candidatus Binatia bacterium]
SASLGLKAAYSSSAFCNDREIGEPSLAQLGQPTLPVFDTPPWAITSVFVNSKRKNIKRRIMSDLSV